MNFLELTINLHSMRILCDLALSQTFGESERAQLKMRVRLDGRQLYDGEIITLGDVFKIVSSDEDLRPLSIEIVELDPSQDEPNLVSGEFFDVDEDDDPENQINIKN